MDGLATLPNGGDIASVGLNACRYPTLGHTNPIGPPRRAGIYGQSGEEWCPNRYGVIQQTFIQQALL